MAKDGDFIMRPSQGWVIGLYNNSPDMNNVTKSIYFIRLAGVAGTAGG